MTAPYYWTNKVGPRHIADNNKAYQTLCGRSMLGGINYSYGFDRRNDAEPCRTCAQAFFAATDSKRTT